MGALTLTLTLLLVTVFVTAAIGKLTDQAGSRQALADFGVPARFRRLLAIGLPAAELLVAVFLLGPTTKWWGALGALALLVGFLSVIAFALRRGVAPPCHCFGRIHSAPIGRSTLARIAVLAAMAGVVLVTGQDHQRSDVRGWFGSLTALEATVTGLAVGLLVSVMAAASLFVQLTAANGRLLLRIEELERRSGRSTGDSGLGLAVGTAAPDFMLNDLDGAPVSLGELRSAGRPVVLVFTDPNCGPCAALLPDLVAWEAAYATRVTLALISSGTRDANRNRGAATLHHALLQQDREVARAYGAHATPTAVLVRADGRVGSAVAIGAAAISSLVTHTVGPAEITADAVHQ